jgi:hypothetical protein
MILTRAQRFAYTLTILVFASIVTLVSLNLFAFDLFFVLLIVSFFVVLELTTPVNLVVAWRRNLPVFVAFFLIAFAAIIYTRLLPYL